MTCYIKRKFHYRLNQEFDINLSSKEQRRIIISEHDDKDDFKEDELEEINVNTLIQDYLTLIENKNFDLVGNFLVHFSEQLEHKVFTALERTDEDYFSFFSTIFFQQLSNQTNEINLFQYLHTFYQLQTQFRLFSYLTFKQENLTILLNFFDFENLQIIKELISIFTEYLQINCNVFHILKDKLYFLSQLNDSDILHLIIKLINKYLIELTGKSILDQELLSIEPFLFSLLSDENIDSLTLKTLATALMNILNNSLQAFLTTFDQKMLDFIEELLIISSSNQDFNSQIALKNTLESILILTSSKIPPYFKSQISLIFENFNLSLLLEPIKNSQSSIAILSLHCIYNFALGGSIDRILSSSEIIDCFLEVFEIGKFEVKQEIVLFFANLIEISPIDNKVAYLLDRKMLTLILDLLPTLQIYYVLNILKSLLNSVSQCLEIPNFGDIKNALMEVHFLDSIGSIDYQDESAFSSEIQEINTMFIELLGN